MKRTVRAIWLVALVVAAATFALFANEETEAETCAGALITINLDDITVGFAGTGDPFPDDWRTVDDRHVVEANAELIPAARAAGLLVVYLYGNYTVLEEGQVVARFATKIAPEEGDLLIGRPGYNLNVFTGTILLATLRERGIEKLLFAGLNTGFCVNTSAQWGLRLGFDVTIVADAHSGGTPAYAATYNEYWPTLGIAAVPIEELDFDAFCQPATSEETEE